MQNARPNISLEDLIKMLKMLFFYEGTPILGEVYNAGNFIRYTYRNRKNADVLINICKDIDLAVNTRKN